jgi:hypothetical protein
MTTPVKLGAHMIDLMPAKTLTGRVIFRLPYCGLPDKSRLAGLDRILA